MPANPRLMALTTSLVAVLAAGGHAMSIPAPATLPYAPTGALGRLDVAPGQHLRFDTSSGRYAVDGEVRNTRAVRITLPDAVALRSATESIPAFDFTSVRVAAGARVTVTGRYPLVLLSRGSAELAAPFVLDGARGAAGRKGAGGGGGGGGGAIAVFARDMLTVSGTVSVRGGAGGPGDVRPGAATTSRAFTGGAGGGGSVVLGSAERVVLDGTVLTWSGDHASRGPVSLVGDVRYGTHATVNGQRPDLAGVRRLTSLAHAAFDISGGGGGGGGGGSGLPMTHDPVGYADQDAAGGLPGAGGGAGGDSGHAVAGGAGGSGGAAGGLGAGGGGGGGGGAYSGPGGFGGPGSGGSSGAGGASGGSGGCNTYATGGGGGGGGNGTVTGGGGGDGGGGGNVGGSGGGGSNGSDVGGGGGGGGGGGDSCGSSAPGTGGVGGAGGLGGAPGGAGSPGAAGVPASTIGNVVSLEDGALCQLFAAQTLASEDPALRTGTMSLGPMRKGDFAGGPAELTCAIQINADRHEAWNTYEVRALDVGGVIAATGAVEYYATPDDQVYVCPEYRDYGAMQSWYFDSSTQAWSTDPSAACAAATHVG